MNKKEEKMYYKWLEDIVKSRTTSDSLCMYKSKEERTNEIMLLARYIQQKNPSLFDKLLSKTIKKSKASDATMKDIHSYLTNTNKGTAVTWTNKDGNEFIFVNVGTNLKNNQQIIILENNIVNKNINYLKKTLFLEILQKDIGFVYGQLQKKERNKQKINSEIYFKALFSNSKRQPINSVGSFEKNFKKNIRSQGFGASSMITAQVIIKNMNNSEKKQLEKSFAAMGVKNGVELQDLLDKWKKEALIERKTPRPLFYSKEQTISR